MKRIGVIGSINRDTITHANATQTESYGGVLYTALALAYLGGAGIETWLLCEYGRDVGARVRELFASCPSLRTDGAREVPRPNLHSQIRYLPDATKEECLTGDADPLTWEALAPLVPALDGLVVNFITGFEIELATLRLVRERLQGPILMDVHSLTLGRRSGGERYWRKPDNWEAWIAQADVVQMNDAEAALLGDLEAPGGPAAVSRGLLRGFARKLLALGPHGAVITLGTEGAFGALFDPNAGHDAPDDQLSQRQPGFADHHDRRVEDFADLGGFAIWGEGSWFDHEILRLQLQVFGICICI